MKKNLPGFLFILFASLLSPALLSQYSTAGPTSGSNFSNDNSIGDFSFSTPPNAAASDNSRSSASALLVLLNGSTHYLKVTGFGFSIPAVSTITGIKVEVEKSALDISILATVKDNSIRLVKSGSAVGDDKASSANWTGSDGYYTYGDTTDAWGTTWTSTEVNSPDFGLVFSARINGLASLIPTARVDHIRVTVFYITALPIHFLDFKVESKKENEVLLKWTTGDNDEKVNFVVQRSINGTEWTDIHTVPGVISWNIKSYEYTDQPPTIADRFYYRVKMILRSGATLFTKIVFADVGKQEGFVLFPNPAREIVYVSCDGDENVSLFSMTGEKMNLKVARISGTQVKIDLSFLRPGLYVIRVREKQRQLLVR